MGDHSPSASRRLDSGTRHNSFMSDCWLLRIGTTSGRRDFPLEEQIAAPAAPQIGPPGRLAAMKSIVVAATVESITGTVSRWERQTHMVSMHRRNLPEGYDWQWGHSLPQLPGCTVCQNWKSPRPEAPRGPLSFGSRARI